MSDIMPTAISLPTGKTRQSTLSCVINENNSSHLLFYGALSHCGATVNALTVKHVSRLQSQHFENKSRTTDKHKQTKPGLKTDQITDDQMTYFLLLCVRNSVLCLCAIFLFRSLRLPLLDVFPSTYNLSVFPLLYFEFATLL